MRIQLLGTSSAEGWPGLFCDCRVCLRSRELKGKNLRTRASALIDGALKVDLPPDTLVHVHRGLDMRRVECVLFTHAHDDHCAETELQYASWMFVPKPIERRMALAGPGSVMQRLAARVEMERMPFLMKRLCPWETAVLGRWRVTPVAAQHDPDQECFNYLIERDGRTLLYATDTGWYEEPTWRFLAGRSVDAAVIECTKGLDESGYQGHLSIPQVIAARQRLLAEGGLKPGGRVVTTHHSHLGGLLHDELQAHFLPHRIEVGFDGMRLDI